MKNLKGAILVFIGAIGFSSKAVLVKLSYLGSVDAITILTLRMLFALPIYLFVLYLNRRRLKIVSGSLASKDWFNILIMGFVGYYLASIFDFIGLQYITASLERLILFIYPTLVVVLSAIFLKKKISSIECLSLGLTYIGIIIVFFENSIATQANIWIGTFFVFSAALAYAFYQIGSGELIPKFGSINFTALAMVISSVAVFIHFLCFKNISSLFVSSDILWLAFYMAIIATVIPTFFIAEGVRILGAGQASIVASVGPISTIILAYIFLGESFGLLQLLGTILVLSGVLVVTLKKNEPKEH